MTYNEILVCVNRLARFPHLFAWSELRGELPLEPNDLDGYYDNLRQLHRLALEEPTLFLSLTRAAAADIGVRYCHRQWVAQRCAFMLTFFADVNEFLRTAAHLLCIQKQVQP